jgi:BolA family transcriptional regulator, general stress-responsive regulator
MSVSDEIKQRLEQAFTPTRLEVINESHRHRGHAGDDGSGESHFRVVLRAPGLADLSRVARHRAIHDALGADLIARIHALAIDAAA